jgi:hypothetical protein
MPQVTHSITPISAQGKLVGLRLNETASAIQALKSKTLRCRRTAKWKKNLDEVSLDRVGEALNDYTIISPALDQHPHFASMLAKIMINSLCVPASSLGKNLASLTQDDWEAIGGSLALHLATNTDSKSAVAEFIAKYPALKEFDALYAWFRPMMETVAQKLLKEAPWGVKVRLFGGAGLSTLDMVTDINMIIILMGATATAGYGQAMLLMLVFCVMFHLLVAFMQNRKSSKRVMVREILCVVFCVKAGVDAHRVASGKEQGKHEVIDPKMEMSK